MKHNYFRLLSELSISKYLRAYAKERGMRFPSPLGVIYFQISRRLASTLQRKFPSPLGVIYFQIYMQVTWWLCYRIISVSSRSYLFPNETDMTVTERNIRFPSPLGVIYFQITSVENYTKTLVDFRLLSELSISKSSMKQETSQWGKFPSPLGVIYFQILSFKLQSLCTLQLEFAC